MEIVAHLRQRYDFIRALYVKRGVPRDDPFFVNMEILFTMIVEYNLNQEIGLICNFSERSGLAAMASFLRFVHGNHIHPLSELTSQFRNDGRLRDARRDTGRHEFIPSESHLNTLFYRWLVHTGSKDENLGLHIPNIVEDVQKGSQRQATPRWLAEKLILTFLVREGYDGDRPKASYTHSLVSDVFGHLERLGYPLDENKVNRDVQRALWHLYDDSRHYGNLIEIRSLKGRPRSYTEIGLDHEVWISPRGYLFARQLVHKFHYILACLEIHQKIDHRDSASEGVSENAVNEVGTWVARLLSFHLRCLWYVARDVYNGDPQWLDRYKSEYCLRELHSEATLRNHIQFLGAPEHTRFKSAITTMEASFRRELETLHEQMTPPSPSIIKFQLAGGVVS